MPVLARAIEEAGISTIVVTMMPFWTEKLGTPRTLGVEFPFGHPIGRARGRDGQRSVIRRALNSLRDGNASGMLEHFDQPWLGDEREWRRRWQPAEPSPIITFMRERAQRQAQARHDAPSSA